MTLQKREFCRKRNSSEKAANGPSHQKVPQEMRPTRVQQFNPGGPSRQAKEALNKEAGTRTVCPRRQFFLQILDICSSGAPSKQRIGWNYNACNTE